MIPPALPSGKEDTEQRSVIRFGTAGREVNLAGIRLQNVGNHIARLIHGASHIRSETMHRRGVAKAVGIAEVREHGIAHPAINRGRGSIIQVKSTRLQHTRIVPS